MALYAKRGNLDGGSMVDAAHPTRSLVELTADHHLTNGVTFEESNGLAWNRRYGSALETHLGRLLWADVTVALIGQGVPPGVAKLRLRHRLPLYCLLVEGIIQEETIQIMGCTEWDVERSLRDGLRAVEDYVQA